MFTGRGYESNAITEFCIIRCPRRVRQRSRVAREILLFAVRANGPRWKCLVKRDFCHRSPLQNSKGLTVNQNCRTLRIRWFQQCVFGNRTFGDDQCPALDMFGVLVELFCVVTIAVQQSFVFVVLNVNKCDLALMRNVHCSHIHNLTNSKNFAWHPEFSSSRNLSAFYSSILTTLVRPILDVQKGSCAHCTHEDVLNAGILELRERRQTVPFMHVAAEYWQPFPRMMRFYLQDQRGRCRRIFRCKAPCQEVYFLAIASNRFWRGCSGDGIRELYGVQKFCFLANSAWA